MRPHEITKLVDATSIETTFSFSTLQPRVRFSTFPKYFISKKKYNVTEIFWRICSEASGNRLDYFKLNHLVLSCGKLVL